jgi:hypothetical protein
MCFERPETSLVSHVVLKLRIEKKFGKYSIHNIKYIRYMWKDINTTSKKCNKKENRKRKVVNK